MFQDEKNIVKYENNLIKTENLAEEDHIQVDFNLHIEENAYPGSHTIELSL